MHKVSLKQQQTIAIKFQTLFCIGHTNKCSPYLATRVIEYQINNNSCGCFSSTVKIEIIQTNSSAFLHSTTTNTHKQSSLTIPHTTPTQATLNVFIII